MDELDMKLLAILQRDSSLSSAQLAEKVGLSVSATSERVRRLNASSLISGNRAVLDPQSLGLELCAFMFIDLAPRADESAFLQAINSVSEIQEAHHITGPHSWLLKIRVRSTAALQKLLAQRIKALDNVVSTETIVVLKTAKETTEQPLSQIRNVEERE